MRTDGQTDTTQLTVAFHNFAKAPKKLLSVKHFSWLNFGKGALVYEATLVRWVLAGVTSSAFIFHHINIAWLYKNKRVEVGVGYATRLCGKMTA
jgi:hypothetical protein